jgi:exoribonuclease-2
VAIADVDALVPKDAAIDDHAAGIRPPVYTTAAIFPMLPETLSTGLTSLNQDEDRPAVGSTWCSMRPAPVGSEIYRGQVRNRRSSPTERGRWLEGDGPAPRRLAEVPGPEANLQIQDGLAQKLAALRHRRGALSPRNRRGQAGLRWGHLRISCTTPRIARSRSSRTS